MWLAKTASLLAERLLTIIRHGDQLVLLLDGDALALQLSSRCLGEELISSVCVCVVEAALLGGSCHTWCLQ